MITEEEQNELEQVDVEVGVAAGFVNMINFYSSEKEGKMLTLVQGDGSEKRVLLGPGRVAFIDKHGMAVEMEEEEFDLYFVPMNKTVSKRAVGYEEAVKAFYDSEEEYGDEEEGVAEDDGEEEEDEEGEGELQGIVI